MNPNKTLELAILPDDDAATDQFGTFHIYVPSLGETYGNQVPIIARKEGFEWPHFTIGDGADGGVYPQMTAASQTWYGMLTAALPIVVLVAYCVDSAFQLAMLITWASTTLGSVGVSIIRTGQHRGNAHLPQ